MMSDSTPYGPELRAYFIEKIMGFRDEPETGDFYAEFYLIPLLDLHGGTLEYLPDHLLYAEYVRAPIISGFLAMGLISGYRFRCIAAMSAPELEAYTSYCAQSCAQLSVVDLNDPPEWLAWMNL